MYIYMNLPVSFPFGIPSENHYSTLFVLCKEKKAGLLKQTCFKESNYLIYFAGPAATKAFPASFVVYLAKFLTKRSAKS